MGDQSNVIMSLRPVSFRYKESYDPTGSPQYGLIAEEVEQHAPQLVVYDDAGRPYAVHYDMVNAMMLNELQALYHNVQAQRAEMDDLRSQHQTDVLAIETLQQKVDSSVGLGTACVERFQVLAEKVAALERRPLGLPQNK